MTIPPRFMDELRSRLTLSDVVGKRVRLTRAGREFKGCCPFHNEKTPSFYVNDDKQFFHCFGCGAHGDAVGFVMRHDNLSFIEALEGLVAQVGMQVPKASPQEVERSKKEKSLYSLLDDAAKWMEAQLKTPEHRKAFEYMLGRGVSEDLIAQFRIGFAPADGQAIRRHLAKQGYTDAQMIEAGVLRRSDKGGEPYAFFRERVMFPVPDRRGRVVAFGGRILPEHLRAPDRGDFKPPKYVNSSDTPLFHKGQMLYGEPHARQAAAEGQPLVVVEGYLDVIASFRAGVRGALAPLGTALTEEQILVLWKMIPETPKVPILCFDGDEAGRRAAARAAQRILPLLKPDHSVKIAFLPQGQDPDTLVNGQGAGALKAVLNAALPLVECLWREHAEGRDLSTPELRAGLAKALEDEVLKIPDREVQHYYRQTFRDKVRAAFAPAPFQKSGNYNKKQGVVSISSTKNPVYSRYQTTAVALLSSGIQYPLLLIEEEEYFAGMSWLDSRLDSLRQVAQTVLAEYPDLDAASLQTHLRERGYTDELSRLLSPAVQTHWKFAKPGHDPAEVLGAAREAFAEIDRLRHQAEEAEARRRSLQEI
jgi:DNA primase